MLVFVALIFNAPVDCSRFKVRKELMEERK